MRNSEWCRELIFGHIFTADAQNRLSSSTRSKICPRHSLQRFRFPIRQMHFHYRVEVYRIVVLRLFGRIRIVLWTILPNKNTNTNSVASWAFWRCTFYLPLELCMGQIYQARPVKHADRPTRSVSSIENFGRPVISSFDCHRLMHEMTSRRWNYVQHTALSL